VHKSYKAKKKKNFFGNVFSKSFETNPDSHQSSRAPVPGLKLLLRKLFFCVHIWIKAWQQFFFKCHLKKITVILAIVGVSIV